MNQEIQSYSASAENSNVSERRSIWESLKLELRKSPFTARFGIIIILLYVLVAIFAPVLAPFGQAQVFPSPYDPWSSTHIFGTDQIGRDVFSRMIYGARNTVGIAVATTILSFLIGGSLGLAAAIDRRWIDQVLSRSVDVLMAIPSLIFALVLLSIFICLYILYSLLGQLTQHCIFSLLNILIAFSKSLIFWKASFSIIILEK